MIVLESKVNKIIKLETGMKYVVLKQAVYKNETYYIAVKLDKDENPISTEISFFHEVMFDNKPKVEEITDTDLIKYLYSYMQF